MQRVGWPLDDAWPLRPKDHWLKTRWVSTDIEMKRTTTDHTRLWNPKKATIAQTILDFSTAHRTRSALAASMWQPLFKEDIVFFIFNICFVRNKKKWRKKRSTRKNDDLKKVFLNWKPNAGYTAGAKPKRKRKEQMKQRKMKKKTKKRKKAHFDFKKKFSIENQMQVIPLARNPKEKKQRRKIEKHKEEKNIKKKTSKKGTQTGKKENTYVLFFNHILTPWQFCFYPNSNGGMTRQKSIAGHCLFSLPKFLFYLRYAIHVLGYTGPRTPDNLYIFTV